MPFLREVTEGVIEALQTDRSLREGVYRKCARGQQSLPGRLDDALPCAPWSRRYAPVARPWQRMKTNREGRPPGASRPWRP